LAGQLAHGGEPVSITVSNLSLGGALVSAGVKYAMGARVVISFVVPTQPDAIEVGATVRWSDDKATGLQFDGLRARDVWALNKYFEQLQSSP
jgi:PilZ domain